MPLGVPASKEPQRRGIPLRWAHLRGWLRVLGPGTARCCAGRRGRPAPAALRRERGRPAPAELLPVTALLNHYYLSGHKMRNLSGTLEQKQRVFPKWEALMRLAATRCFMGVVWRRRRMFHLAWELPNFVSCSFVSPPHPASSPSSVFGA